MALLAIDTSSSVCVLGVRQGENTWVDETDLGRTHSKEILPRIQALLDGSDVSKSELECIVFGRGPGSFTGLRIGIGVVQGMAYGLSIPVVGISSLACLAQQYLESEGDGALVALNARNTEVYFGAYQKLAHGVKLIDREGVFEAAEIPLLDSSRSWLGIGSGWKHSEQLTRASGIKVLREHLDPVLKAADLLDLGQIAIASGKQTSAFEALPEYLREQVAAKPGEK